MFHKHFYAFTFPSKHFFESSAQFSSVAVSAYSTHDASFLRAVVVHTERLFQPFYSRHVAYVSGVPYLVALLKML
jgi:hypothetical protein